MSTHAVGTVRVYLGETHSMQGYQNIVIATPSIKRMRPQDALTEGAERGSLLEALNDENGRLEHHEEVGRGQASQQAVWTRLQGWASARMHDFIQFQFNMYRKWDTKCFKLRLIWANEWVFMCIYLPFFITFKTKRAAWFQRCPETETISLLLNTTGEKICLKIMFISDVRPFMKPKQIFPPIQHQRNLQTFATPLFLQFFMHHLEENQLIFSQKKMKQRL